MSLGANKQALMGAAGGAAAAADFYDYQIANSVRTHTSTSSSITRTPSSAGNRATWCISMWMKRSTITTGTNQMIFEAGTSGDSSTRLFWAFNGTYDTIEVSSGTVNYGQTTAVFRDTSAYYHIFIKNASDVNTVYVNGVSVKTSSISGNTAVNSTVAHGLGCRNAGGSSSYEGYISEFLLFDGTAYDPTDVAETKNGVWIPKDPSGLTLSGTNTTWLKFADSSSLGTDSSGQGNTWTIGSDIATHDQMLDSPTFNSDSNGGNFATLNPLGAGSYNTLSEGNLRNTGNTGVSVNGAPATMGAGSGQWYWEVRITTLNESHPTVGISAGSVSNATSPTTGDVANLLKYTGDTAGLTQMTMTNDVWGTYGETETGLAAYSAGDICMLALDIDNKKIWYGKNGTWFNSGDPAAGSNAQQTWTGTGFDIFPVVGSYSSSVANANFGSDGTFAGTETAQGNADENGYGNFYYTPPDGFVALCSGNLPTADAVDPAQTDDDYPQELFFMSQYSGNGSGRTITTENQPDLLMIRHYSTGQNWYTLDSTRVITDNKFVDTNSTDAEDTLPQANITSVGATSVGISSGTWLNSGGSLYQMWMWRANGGTTSSNGIGDITSTVQVDPSGCFSIVKYTGESATRTIGHGLSATPQMILIKALNNTYNWAVYTKTTGASEVLFLNSDAATQTGAGTLWGGGTEPTPSVFSVGDGSETGKSVDYIAYVFANCEGYIKSGSYEGNGDADGTFVYTGFRPAFIVTKSIDSTSDWQAFDDLRAGYNVDNNAMAMNEADAQSTTDMIDILSNGFKMRITTDPNIGETYVYLAFAKNPFQYATAR